MEDLTLHTMGQGIENVAFNCNEGKVDTSLTTSMINCQTILTGISHEVRTHMNAIVAFSYLMGRNSCDDSEREDFSSQILLSCEHLIGLFDNFLDSAILETGNSKADFKICRLNNILDELLSEFREILKKEANDDITLVSETGITDDTEVVIDSNRVLKVIRSLFQNALKNTKSGYIKIGYYFRDDKVTFYILDSGQGYFKCKEFLYTENLNESLSRYNDTVSAINLTLAKKIIQMLSGSLWVECNGLTGTGIYFSIPVKVAESSDIKINKYLSSVIAI